LTFSGLPSLVAFSDISLSFVFFAPALGNFVSSFMVFFEYLSIHSSPAICMQASSCLSLPV
jgi:hypothetical protein